MLVRRHYMHHYMNTQRFTVGLLFALSLMIARHCSAASGTNEINSWSAATNGLQARVTLVERSKINSTRWIVPYLELRNVRNLAHPMEVRCDNQHVRFALVDASGRPVGDGQVMDRSGP